MRIAPVAWQHILLNGHYTFQNSNEIIYLDALVMGLKLGERKNLGFRRRTPIKKIFVLSLKRSVVY